jgi:hypothetical protein
MDALSRIHIKTLSPLPTKTLNTKVIEGYEKEPFSSLIQTLGEEGGTTERYKIGRTNYSIIERTNTNTGVYTSEIPRTGRALSTTSTTLRSQGTLASYRSTPRFRVLLAWHERQYSEAHERM